MITNSIIITNRYSTETMIRKKIKNSTIIVARGNEIIV